MTRAKISEYSATANDNTDVNGINIAEGCPPSSMNNMGREIMAALKRFQVGSDGDGVTVGGSLVVSGSTSVNTFNVDVISEKTSAAGVTVDGVLLKDGGLNTSGQVVFNDAGADVDFRVEGDTDANLMFVDASTDRVGIGTSSPTTKLHVAGTGTQGITVERTDASTAGVFQLLSGNSTNVINASTAKPISFEINSAEVARFTETGGYLRMASGTGGIQFNADTAAANALDDYEEGTWTPVFNRDGTSPTITYGVREGKYTKIGNMVTCWITVNNITVSSAGTGNNKIDGLPFAIGNSTYGGTGGIGYNDAITNAVYGVVLNNTATSIRFRSGTRSQSDEAGGWTSGGYLGLTFSYFV